MNTTITAVISALSILLGSVGTLWLTRTQIRGLKDRARQDTDSAVLATRAADSAAHTAAQQALAAVSGELARSSFQYAEQLRADMDRMRTRHADEMGSAHAQIDDLRRRVAELTIEVEGLRRQLSRAVRESGTGSIQDPVPTHPKG